MNFFVFFFHFSFPSQEPRKWKIQTHTRREPTIPNRPCNQIYSIFWYFVIFSIWYQSIYWLLALHTHEFHFFSSVVSRYSTLFHIDYFSSSHLICMNERRNKKTFLRFASFHLEIFAWSGCLCAHLHMHWYKIRIDEKSPEEIIWKMETWDAKKEEGEEVTLFAASMV